MERDESPMDAVVREYLEETGVTICPEEIIAIRFNTKNWYVAFRAAYVSGEPRSDGDENSEVIWMDVNEALTRDDVPGLTKDLIRSAINGKEGFKRLPYDSVKDCPNSLWGV